MPLLGDVQRRIDRGRSFLRSDPPSFGLLAQGMEDRSLPIDDRVNMVMQAEERLGGEELDNWSLRRGRRGAAMGGAVVGGALGSVAGAGNYIQNRVFRKFEDQAREAVGRYTSEVAEAFSPGAQNTTRRIARHIAREEGTREAARAFIDQRNLYNAATRYFERMGDANPAAAADDYIRSIGTAGRSVLRAGSTQTIRADVAGILSPLPVSSNRVGAAMSSLENIAKVPTPLEDLMRRDPLARALGRVARAGTWLSGSPTPVQNLASRVAARVPSETGQLLVHRGAAVLGSRAGLISGAAALAAGAASMAAARRNPSLIPSSPDDLPEDRKDRVKGFLLSRDREKDREGASSIPGPELSAVRPIAKATEILSSPFRLIEGDAKLSPPTLEGVYEQISRIDREIQNYVDTDETHRLSPFSDEDKPFLLIPLVEVDEESPGAETDEQYEESNRRIHPLGRRR